MLFVVGCSSSEMVGEQIGKHSSYEAAEAVLPVFTQCYVKKGLFLAAQCCERSESGTDLGREKRRKPLAMILLWSFRSQRPEGRLPP